MRITASSSVEPDSLAAAEMISTAVREDLDGAPDLAFFFISRHHARHAQEAFSTVAGALGPRHLLGCLGESVLGGAEEYDGDQPAMSLWAATLPEAQIASAALEARETPDGVVFSGMPEGVDAPATLVLLADPFSFPADDFLTHLAQDDTELNVVGGMASAGTMPGENLLFLGSKAITEGAVAVALGGNLRVQVIVSQGCRPFGKPLVVTSSRENFLFELGGKPALEKFSDQARTLDETERSFLAKGLHLGRAVDARQVATSEGEFLVRNVIGVSQENGALVVGDELRPGQTVQFHLRDPKSASDELVHLLKKAHTASQEPRGALLFTCNGRGRRLFSEPSHDASCVAREYKNLPTAGFFAAGELGPVGRENHLHGFTAVVALFAPT